MKVSYRKQQLPFPKMSTEITAFYIKGDYGAGMWHYNCSCGRMGIAQNAIYNHLVRNHFYTYREARETIEHAKADCPKY